MSREVRHADFWGLRELFDRGRLVGGKYRWLWGNDVSTTEWTVVNPGSPSYFFRPIETAFADEYSDGWIVTRIFPLYSTDIVTARDRFVIDFEDGPIRERIRTFLDSDLEDGETKERLRLSENYAWRMSEARKQLRGVHNWERCLTDVLYRPFDHRRIIYHPSVVWRLRREVMRHLLAGDNLAVITSRLTKGETFRHAQVTRNIVEVICMSPKTSNNGFVFPLYLYPDRGKPIKEHMDEVQTWPEGKEGRRPNLDHKFVEELAAGVKLTFVPDGRGDLKETFGPEDVLDYICGLPLTYVSDPVCRVSENRFPARPVNVEATLVPQTVRVWCAICVPTPDGEARSDEDYIPRAGR